MTTRILHVVGGMDRGGVETWLMHVLRNIDRSRFQMDFLVHTDKPCAYDDEIRALGSRIIPCLHPSQPLRYARNLRRILREYGPYDVVHSHVHHFSGYVLWLAKQAGVPVRIAHSHSNTTVLEVNMSLQRHLYLAVMRAFISRYATVGLGVSKSSCAALYGQNWQHDSRWQILYYGIDLAPFETPIDRGAVRAEFGIPENAFVVGHVGSFRDVKNHRFIVQIAEELVHQKPETRILLVGDGPLRPNVEQQVRDANLTKHVIFAGLRDDIPRLMIGAMDIFLFPSFYEGLGIVLIEAQASGLPCVISNVIPAEAEYGGAFSRLSLDESPAMWGNAIVAAVMSETKPSQISLFKHLQQSSFNIKNGLEKLTRIYCPEGIYD